MMLRNYTMIYPTSNSLLESERWLKSRSSNLLLTYSVIDTTWLMHSQSMNSYSIHANTYVNTMRQCTHLPSYFTSSFLRLSHDGLHTIECVQRYAHDRWNPHDGTRTMEPAWWNSHDRTRGPTMKCTRWIRTIECAQWDGIHTMGWNPHDRISMMESARWNPHDGIRTIESARWNSYDGVR